jgi:hypothetical protein
MQAAMKQCFAISGFLFLFLLIAGPLHAQPDASCDPVVKPVPAGTTLAKTLVSLSHEYNFSLSFPKNLDRPIEHIDSMKLSRLIKVLTHDINTVLRYKKLGSCTGQRLVELIVLPAGDGEPELIRVEQKPVTEPQKYIYIGNMEQYVTEVLLRKRRPDLAHMTPEQKIEFRMTRKRLKPVLKDEIKQARAERKKGKGRDKGKWKGRRNPVKKQGVIDSEHPAVAQDPG